MIPFNKPYISGLEQSYIAEAMVSGKLSGDGDFTQKAQRALENHLGGGRSLLTTSCTDALEAAALLCDLEPGDEVIVPSFTFVSTANAFALRGARIRFADSLPDHPNVDPASIAALISDRTRVIVPVHYAGAACDMDAIGDLAGRHGLTVVEDAAQAIASSYRGRPLGTFGALSAFSFHETKNIISGEGGSLHVNDPTLVTRAEIVREKGTNRSAFFRGEIDKYGWVDLGSSFLPSELTAAFLLAQIEALDAIQEKRVAIWQRYAEALGVIGAAGDVGLPTLPPHATNNGHMYWLLCNSLDTRSRLIAHLKNAGVIAAFHYQALHASPYFAAKHGDGPLPHADRYSDTLLRLPLYAGMTAVEQEHVIAGVLSFFGR